MWRWICAYIRAIKGPTQAQIIADHRHAIENAIRIAVRHSSPFVKARDEFIRTGDESALREMLKAIDTEVKMNEKDALEFNINETYGPSWKKAVEDAREYRNNQIQEFRDEVPGNFGYEEDK